MAAVRRGLVDAARALRLGDPLNAETTLGPMATAKFAEMVRRQVRQALERGAAAHVPPNCSPRAPTKDAYLAPQVLTGVDHDMAVMLEESFGPVVGIMKVRDDAEAMRLMNDSPYGLTASIWTQDLDAAERRRATSRPARSS